MGVNTEHFACYKYLYITISWGHYLQFYVEYLIPGRSIIWPCYVKDLRCFQCGCKQYVVYMYSWYVWSTRRTLYVVLSCSQYVADPTPRKILFWHVPIENSQDRDKKCSKFTSSAFPKRIRGVELGHLKTVWSARLTMCFKDNCAKNLLKSECGFECIL